MFYVYVLRSQKDNKRYIGFTDNLERRFSEHNRGIVKSTRSRRPLDLIYFEEFEVKSEAMHREEFFKTGQGRVYLNSLDK
ncbi:MAG TPA: GIY-YIG nuclease family protein [Ignavibacteriales bacterium]|nr:GIY-YIG nuclease family protein [Ignavibacteriales bacterium]